MAWRVSLWGKYSMRLIIVVTGSSSLLSTFPELCCINRPILQRPSKIHLGTEKWKRWKWKEGWWSDTMHHWTQKKPGQKPDCTMSICNRSGNNSIHSLRANFFYKIALNLTSWSLGIDIHFDISCSCKQNTCVKMIHVSMTTRFCFSYVYCAFRFFFQLFYPK